MKSWDKIGEFLAKYDSISLVILNFKKEMKLWVKLEKKGQVFRQIVYFLKKFR